MNNYRITLSIDTNIEADELQKYLLRALRDIQWASLPHPHMRVAIESDAYELEVFDSRAKEKRHCPECNYHLDEYAENETLCGACLDLMIATERTLEDINNEKKENK
jgi:hypothetical protein